jgi:uncharacterized protein YndB with AHSA1/START domain
MPELRHQITINASPAKVYEALSTEGGLRSWWTADATMGGTAGGKAELGFDKRRTVFKMKIEELEAARRMVWSCLGDPPEWTGTTLSWDLATDGGGTIVRFHHSGWKAVTEMYAICNSSWGELMHRLKDYAEGRNPGPHWKE